MRMQMENYEFNGGISLRKGHDYHLILPEK